MNDLARSSVRLFLSYIAGLGIGGTVALFYGGPAAFIIVFGGGFYTSFPLFLIALLALIVANRLIMENLAVVCVAAPLLVVMVYMTREFLEIYADRFDLVGYLSIKNVQERAGAALISAAGASRIFYLLSRGNRGSA